MAKKNKRQSRRSNGGTRTATAAAAASITMATADAAHATSERDFNPDYSNTIKDLRRIGILAGTFISILFILAFFLR